MNTQLFRLVGLLLFMFLQKSTACAQQNFGCTFLPLISEGIKTQNKIFIEYLKDKKRGSKNYRYGETITLNTLNSETGGYVNVRNFISVFDDTLFHMSNKILLIDTFGFFTDSCFFNDEKKIKIVRYINDTVSYRIEYPDIIVLKSIRVHNQYFIIAVEHVYSKMQVAFYFRLIANHPPKLDFFRSGDGYE